MKNKKAVVSFILNELELNDKQAYVYVDEYLTWNWKQVTIDQWMSLRAIWMDERWMKRINQRNLFNNQIATGSHK